MSVLTQPGHMLLTRILVPRSSATSVRVNALRQSSNPIPKLAPVATVTFRPRCTRLATSLCVFAGRAAQITLVCPGASAMCTTYKASGHEKPRDIRCPDVSAELQKLAHDDPSFSATNMIGASGRHVKSPVCSLLDGGPNVAVHASCCICGAKACGGTPHGSGPDRIIDKNDIIVHNKGVHLQRRP